MADEIVAQKFCKSCQTAKPITEFGLDCHQPDGRKYKCRPCYNAYTVEYNSRPETYLTCSRCGAEFVARPSDIVRRHYKCKACVNEKAAKFRDANREQLRRMQKAWRNVTGRQRKVNTPSATWAQSLTRARERMKTLRLEMIMAYGGACTCCGETETMFLTLDHKNNDGADHRRKVGSGGSFYYWLRREGYPKDRFQLLCYNCNCAKGYHGFCPHTIRRTRRAKKGNTDCVTTQGQLLENIG